MKKIGLIALSIFAIVGVILAAMLIYGVDYSETPSIGSVDMQ